MMKKKIKKLVTSFRPFLKTLNGLAVDMPRVFVWHRFTAPMKEKTGRVAADVFGWQLDRIRKDFQVLTLDKTLQYFLEHHQWPKRSVILTIDDGYRDFYHWAYPELRKRSLQATLFVTVNFVAGKIWLWPDRLQWGLDESAATEVALPFSGELRRFSLKDLHDKAIAWKICSDHCITLADVNKKRFIRSVLGALQVSCPDKPTEEYRAMTWDELQEMDKNGIEIGSHTMNHPILSRIGQEALTEELGTSKKTLEAKLGHGISTFCYPNSGPGDINETVIASVQEAGYSGAVFGTDLKTWHPDKVPRMGVSSDRTDFLWKLYGGELLQQSIRKG